MKLPSEKEVKNETLSEIADFIAMDMLVFEYPYDNSCQSITEELEQGYEGEVETLPSLDEADRTHLLEHIHIPTINYLEALRKAKENIFSHMLKNKKW
jgi:hypothetical protein